MDRPGRTRKRILWSGGAVLALMLLVPPWVNTVSGNETGDVFYAEIVPGPKPHHCAANIVCGVKVDLARLGLQLTAWAVIFGVPSLIASRR